MVSAPLFLGFFLELVQQARLSTASGSDECPKELDSTPLEES